MSVTRRGGCSHEDKVILEPWGASAGMSIWQIPMSSRALIPQGKGPDSPHALVLLQLGLPAPQSHPESHQPRKKAILLLSSSCPPCVGVGARVVLQEAPFKVLNWKTVRPVKYVWGRVFSAWVIHIHQSSVGAEGACCSW